MGTQEGGWLSFLTSSGTYREDAFERDLLLITAFYYDHGYINVKLGKPEIELSADKQFLYITIPIEEGDQYKIGKIDFNGDLLLPKEEYFKTHDGAARARSSTARSSATTSRSSTTATRTPATPTSTSCR